MSLRRIKEIILHCSDSDVLDHDNIETIRQWHTARGFKGPDGVEGTDDDVGYHYFITRKGMVSSGRKESQVGAHCKGHNAYSLGVCLSGKTFTNFSSPQFEAARRLIIKLLTRYHLTKADLKLHRDYDKGKTCPNFTLEQFWS